MTGPGPVPPAPAKVIPLTPTFKWVFLSVVGLTVVSIALSIALAAFGTGTDMQKTLFAASTDIYKMGFTGIMGLLGGKAL